MAKGDQGVEWKPHSMDGEEYCLRHLHPHRSEYVVPGKKGCPERRFLVDVSYGLHCFTRKQEKGEDVSPARWYSDSRETRVFCMERWHLSSRLPDMIATLGRRRCLHTRGEEFVTLEVVEGGRRFDYAVFFIVSKSSAKGADLNLFVVSAHERFDKLDYTKPVGFHIILMNRYTGKKIKKPS